MTPNRSKAGRRLIALALVLIAGWMVVPRAGGVLVVERSVDDPDAIVMLASHESERLPAAGALARRYPSSVVLLTVPKTVTEFNCERCPFRSAWLVQEGVAEARIHTLPDLTANTRDEALAVLAYWRRTRFDRLAVVTSPYHTRRSLGTFEKVFADTGVEIGIHPAVRTSPAIPERWWLRRYDRGYVLYEWAALVYYRLRFGVPMQLSSQHGPAPHVSSRELPE